MLLKTAYFIKLFLIVVLTTAIFASVEILLDQPALFIFITAGCSALIRLIWHSALKNEKMLAAREIPLNKQERPLHPDLKRAA